MSEIMSIKIEIPGLQQLAQALMQLAAVTKAGGEVPVLQQQMPQQTQTQGQPSAAMVQQAPVQQQMPQGQPSVAMPQQAPVQQQVPQGQVPVQSSAAMVQQAPIQQQMPQGQPPTAMPNQIPTTAVPMTHTTDELAVAASQLVNMGKQARLFEILHGFGVNSLMELPTEKYGAFAGCLKAEGVKF